MLFCACRREWLDAEHGTQAAAAMLAEAAAEEAAAAAALGVRRVGTMDDLRCLDEDLEDRCDAASIPQTACRSRSMYSISSIGTTDLCRASGTCFAKHSA